MVEILNPQVKDIRLSQPHCCSSRSFIFRSTITTPFWQGTSNHDHRVPGRCAAHPENTAFFIPVKFISFLMEFCEYEYIRRSSTVGILP